MTAANGDHSMVDVLNVVGLLSGGKDSCYNLCHCAALGHRIVALATLAPPQGKDELDSYMYQTVGHDAVHLIADAMDLPLYRVTINGRAINQTSTYGDRLPSEPSSSRLDANDETEDLFHLLQKVKRAHPEVNAVSVGAILSNYQRVRVEHVALRAGLQMLPLSFLWQRDQAALLDEMCQAGMHSILIKVAGAGLDDNDLGKSLVQMRPKLHRLNALYGAHICGEGGEYETFTLDCPLFKRRIVLERTTTITHGESSFDGVYYLKVDAARLEDKDLVSNSLATVVIPPLLDELSSQALTAAVRAPACTSNSSHVSPPSKLAQVSSVARCGRWCAFGGIQSMAKGDVEKEFTMAFKNLTDLLAAQDLSMAHLAHLNVYLSSQTHFATLNSVYRTLFGVDPPSRACVAVNLDSARSNILIDAMAYDDRVEPGQASPSRRALHVQGRSHWAAANIGPYSQAVDVQGRITIAGQIGLQQQTLQLAEEPELQITLALQHARRIYKAILEDARVDRRQGWVDGCICWLSDARWLPVAQTVWSYQSRGIDGGGQDEDEGERLTWDDLWLGQGLSPATIPTLFAVLASDGLPRHAAAEWQLSAHDGDRIPMDSTSDEDEEEEPVAFPFASSGTAVLGPWAADWQVVSSRYGASTFGIAQLHKMGGQATSDDTAHLNAALSKADHIRVFYNDEEVLAEVRKELDKLRGLHGRATTFLPVRALFDRQSHVLDVALVWQGNGSGSTNVK